MFTACKTDSYAGKVVLRVKTMVLLERQLEACLARHAAPLPAVACGPGAPAARTAAPAAAAQVGCVWGKQNEEERAGERAGFFQA